MKFPTTTTTATTTTQAMHSQIPLDIITALYDGNSDEDEGILDNEHN